MTAQNGKQKQQLPELMVKQKKNDNNDNSKFGSSCNIRIVEYDDEKHSTAFKLLNEEWINKYFGDFGQLEPKDYEVLDHPKECIVDKGGCILVVVVDETSKNEEEEVIGVCALIKNNSPTPRYDYELGKMAVSSKYQGRGVGYKLGQASLHRAKQMGASNVYLESNTILEPAIKLYRKLGFVKVEKNSIQTSPYARCNIQMMWSTEEKGK